MVEGEINLLEAIFFLLFMAGLDYPCLSTLQLIAGHLSTDSHLRTIYGLNINLTYVFGIPGENPCKYFSTQKNLTATWKGSALNDLE